MGAERLWVTLYSASADIKEDGKRSDSGKEPQSALRMSSAGRRERSKSTSNKPCNYLGEGRLYSAAQNNNALSVPYTLILSCVGREDEGYGGGGWLLQFKFSFSNLGPAAYCGLIQRGNTLRNKEVHSESQLPFERAKSNVDLMVVISHKFSKLLVYPALCLPADAVLRVQLRPPSGSKSAASDQTLQRPLEPEGVWEGWIEPTGHYVLVTSLSRKKKEWKGKKTTDLSVYTGCT